jgi:hypothetical protein
MRRLRQRYNSCESYFGVSYYDSICGATSQSHLRQRVICNLFDYSMPVLSTSFLFYLTLKCASLCDLYRLPFSGLVMAAIGLLADSNYQSGL